VFVADLEKMRRNAVHLITKSPVTKPLEHSRILEIQIQHDFLSLRVHQGNPEPEGRSDKILCGGKVRHRRGIGRAETAPPHIHPQHI
jgi:hypothetical protein